MDNTILDFSHVQYFSTIIPSEVIFQEMTRVFWVPWGLYYYTWWWLLYKNHDISPSYNLSDCTFADQTAQCSDRVTGLGPVTLAYDPKHRFFSQIHFNSSSSMSLHAKLYLNWFLSIKKIMNNTKIMKDNLKNKKIWCDWPVITDNADVTRFTMVFENNEVSNILRTYRKTGLICNIVNFKLICKVQFKCLKNSIFLWKFTWHHTHPHMCQRTLTHTHAPITHTHTHQNFVTWNLSILQNMVFKFWSNG